MSFGIWQFSPLLAHKRCSTWTSLQIRWGKGDNAWLAGTGTNDFFSWGLHWR